MAEIKEAINSERVVQLKALLEILADEIDQRPGARDLASLVKQYRETLREIEALEGNSKDDSEIEELLNTRQVEGKPKPVRKSRASLQRD